VIKNKIGKLLVVSGLPAAGKDTVVSKFLERNPHFSFIVSHTDRPIRKGEINGVHHHFVTTAYFESLITQNHLLEHVKTGLFYKGTIADEFKKVLRGENLIWRIELTRFTDFEETISEKFETQTAETIITNSTKVLLKPESKMAALSRYRNRDRTSILEDFHIRWKFETKHIKVHKHKIPHAVINRTGQLEKTVERIEKILSDKNLLLF